MPRTITLEPSLMVEVCKRFLAGEGPAQIRDFLNASPFSPETSVTREQIYPLLREAAKGGYIALQPPLNLLVREQMSREFDHSPERLHVLDVRSYIASEALANYAAQFVVDEVMRTARERPARRPVRIGFGGGVTVQRTVKALAHKLAKVRDLPDLALHVLSSGLDTEHPDTAPITFLGFFHDLGPKVVEYVGLFVQPLVPAHLLEEVRQSAGVKPAVEKAKEIDIVITSLAAASDEHGELRQFLVQSDEGKRDLARLHEMGHVGDLLYAPFSPERFLEDEDLETRTVSVFQLSDLHGFARQEGRRVVVVAGPCGRCDELKDSALMPLLQNPDMRVWTDLILDLDTALRTIPDWQSDTPKRRGLR